LKVLMLTLLPAPPGAKKRRALAPEDTTEAR
jgi:hypothetical protein